jgi:RNA-directed DNA polymerase
VQTQFANVTQRITEWQRVNWRKAYAVVRNLRQRIFKASRNNDWKRVRGLQKLLLKSYSNVLLAVRRVTQINVGKRTPGIDKLLIKTGPAKAQLVDWLKLWQPWQPIATKGCWNSSSCDKIISDRSLPIKLSSG